MLGYPVKKRNSNQLDEPKENQARKGGRLREEMKNAQIINSKPREKKHEKKRQ